MSKTTTNYGLTLEDDASTKFQEWRMALNGTNNSNMIIIDEVLAGKAKKSWTIAKTLFADQWVLSGSTYIQDIAIEGLTPEQNGLIDTAQNLTESEMETVRKAVLYVSDQREGVLTIASDGETPSCDIPVSIVLFG